MGRFGRLVFILPILFVFLFGSQAPDARAAVVFLGDQFYVIPNGGASLYLTAREKTYLTSAELIEIGHLSGPELNTHGLACLQNGEIVKSKIYFKVAAKKFEGVTSNDADTAYFFLALTRVAALGYDTASDGVDNGLQNVGDIIDAMGGTRVGQDILIPDVLPDSTPSGGALQDFVYAVAKGELEGAQTDLAMVSTNFNTVWTEPLGQMSVESDYGDVLAYEAALNAAIAAIEIQYAYNLDVNVATELNNVDNTIEAILASNPSLLALKSLSPLASAKSHASTAIDGALAAADWIAAETDDQSNDLVNLGASTPEELAQFAATLNTVQQSLEGETVVNGFDTPGDSSDDTIVNLASFFNGLSLRDLLPAFSGDNPTGFLPDTSFGNVLIKLDGEDPALLNTDTNGNGTADILEETPYLYGYYYGYGPVGVFLGWDFGGPQEGTTYKIYYQTSPGVTNQSDLLDTVSAPDSWYMHSPVASNTTYYYRVSAVTAAGESPLSDEISVIVPVPVNFNCSGCGFGDTYVVENESGATVDPLGVNGVQQCIMNVNICEFTNTNLTILGESPYTCSGTQVAPNQINVHCERTDNASVFCEAVCMSTTGP